MNLFAILALGLLLFGGSSSTPKPPTALPGKKPTAPGKVKVKLGPAKIKPVKVVVPSSPRETVAITALAAKQAGTNPLQPNEPAARASAQATADHVRNAGQKYDRARVATWQVFAGLKADGLYGPATAKRLRELGAKNVMGPVFKGAKS